MLAYVNGNYVPIENATVSVRDRGFTLGDGIFEGWRTYGGELARPIVDRHLARMGKSVRYMEQLPPDAVVAEVDEVTREIVKRNHDEILAVGDVFVHSIVTRGVGDEEDDHEVNPTIAVFCLPLDHRRLVNNYRNGARLVPSMMPRNPYLPNDPRVKALSRLALTRQERKQAREGGSTWVVSFDNAGFITEATTAALCIIEGDTIVHAPSWQILGSVSLSVFCQIGQELGYQVSQRPLALYDFLNADGAFLPSTTLGFTWVSEIDGIELSRYETADRIYAKWFDLVGLDFVAQAVERTEALASA